MLHPTPEFRNSDPDATDPDVSRLDLLVGFCKEELAAVQTYEQALTLAPLQKHSDVLGRCYASHARRAHLLQQRILVQGGRPPEGAGVWSSLVTVLETAAATISENLAILLLEEAEDRGVRRYRERLDDLDLANRAFVLEWIVPAQNMTHAAMSALKHAGHA
jgi:demethoxyubiquinone hydroxylase (CLK1/Coq7/Cat5 family)